MIPAQRVPRIGGNDSFTKILLQFNGSNGSTTITDENAGGSAHTWTNHTGSISTTQSKFWGSSYNATGGGWVDTPDSADYTLGSSAFTVESWFYRSGGDGSLRPMCGQSNAASTLLNLLIRLDTSNKLSAFVTTDGATQTGVTGTTSITSTGWHHAAFVRTGNTLKLFLDGVQEGGDVAFSSSVYDSANNFSVGRLGELTSPTWNGFLGPFRLSVGIARWTANFPLPLNPWGK